MFLYVCMLFRAPASHQNSKIAAAVGVPLDDFNAMEMVRHSPHSPVLFISCLAKWTNPGIWRPI